MITNSSTFPAIVRFIKASLLGNTFTHIQFLQINTILHHKKETWRKIYPLLTWCWWWGPLVGKRRVGWSVQVHGWQPHTYPAPPAHACTPHHAHRSDQTKTSIHITNNIKVASKCIGHLNHKSILSSTTTAHLRQGVSPSGHQECCIECQWFLVHYAALHNIHQRPAV